MGWEPLSFPADFEPPELIDIDEWLDHPQPVSPPPRLARRYLPRTLEDAQCCGAFSVEGRCASPVPSTASVP